MGDRGPLRIGMVEPHLHAYGGIRRVVELANRLHARGHDVSFFLPKGQGMGRPWMRCDVPVRPIGDADLDVVLFNDERQWFELDRFPSARRRVFYALHDAALYGKGGSWESLRSPVDLVLANSTWTADQVERRTGHRPTVLLGGIDRTLFHPRPDAPRHDLLTPGGGRWWKGTENVREAARRAGVALETYADLDLSQDLLARTYARSRAVAVGSLFEGFGQPGLEALASGVPLVTTDNGGCREYAVDGETALLVPPGDVDAMAAAVRRVLDEPALARTLVANGLDVVAERFDWEERTDELVALLDGVVAAPSAAPVVAPRPVPDAPDLTVVVLSWNNLGLTMECVESIRQHTDLPYELVVVDNGSTDGSARYAGRAADHPVLLDRNEGFAAGMNHGLAAARGRVVAFCNNDTVLRAGWASALVATLDEHPRAGIVVPAVTTAQNPVNVRTEPGPDRLVLDPFEAPPAAVVYAMPTALARALGGWDESYAVASGEDVDLAFTVWCNDLDIVVDERVLVDHVGKASARLLDDWERTWAANRRLFLDRWGSDDAVTRLDDVDPERFARNRRTAAATARWMADYFSTRDRLRAEQQAGVGRMARRIAGRGRDRVLDPTRQAAVASARRVIARLPPPARRQVRRLARSVRPFVDL